jgi:transposase-like protein
LSRGEVEELISVVLGGQVDGLTLHRLWMATQGNSLLLRELVLKTLEREVRELRRANEILKSAAAFFGAELDRRPSR